MNDEFGLLCFGIFIGVCAAMLISSLSWSHMEEECSREHNVHECEYIYVPKEVSQ
jgi:hypothetical protein